MDMPFSIRGSVNLEHTQHTFDSHVFPPETNKIASLGRIRRQKFLVYCNGKGRMDFKALKSHEEQIRSLNKLRVDGIITDEEFEQKKKELLEDM